MRDKNPPPPKVGDKYNGPRLSHRPTTYHVRAIVDNEGEDPDFGWLYQVVFRFYSPRKGWRYLVEASHALGVGLYTKVASKKAKP
jgi:hypothetical protein